MALDPDHGFGLLSPEDQEKIELILAERSEGSYSAPALHGMLTASVVGPKPVPMDWILQTVLSPPESEAIGFDNFPEFSWVVEKTQELLLRIGWVFQQDPEMFRLLVYMPKLKEGDTTPDPQTWCNGFVEGMECHRENWEPLIATEFGFEMIAPILMTFNPDEWEDEWEDENIPNPFTALTQSELCDRLKMAVLALYEFWSSYNQKFEFRPNVQYGRPK